MALLDRAYVPLAFIRTSALAVFDGAIAIDIGGTCATAFAATLEGDKKVDPEVVVGIVRISSLGELRVVGYVKGCFEAELDYVVAIVVFIDATILVVIGAVLVDEQVTVIVDAVDGILVDLAISVVVHDAPTVLSFEETLERRIFSGHAIAIIVCCRRNHHAVA
jgi:hypothetical protein